MANVSMGITASELFACNPFRVLGVAVNSHSSQIEEAYKQLSSLAAEGRQQSYMTPFDFPSLPKVSRSSADVNTAYGKLSSNGYRCFAYSDPQFTAALSIDDIALNITDISCYDCFLRCYMWLVVNDSKFEWPEMWIPLAKYIDKLIDSQPDQWPQLFDNRFPDEMIGQGGQAYQSFHQTFCEIILLPIKEMVRGSMRCQRAIDILKVAKVDVDGPLQKIDIPQANKPLPGQPAPKLKLAVREGMDVSAHETEHNDFGGAAASVISAVDISSPAPAPAQSPVRPVPAPAPTPVPAPVRPSPSLSQPTPAPAPVRPVPTPVAPAAPAPSPAPAAPAPQPAPSLTRPAPNLSAPASPVQPAAPAAPVRTVQPAPQPAPSLTRPAPSLASPAAPVAPAPAPATPPAPAPAPAAPVPHFDPIQKLDNNTAAQSVSLGGMMSSRAGSLQTSTLMSAEDIAAEEEEQKMYTDTLIQLLRSNKNTGMKAVDTTRSFNNGEGQLEDGFQHIDLSMDELKLNSKTYDATRLQGENAMPRTFEQKYKKINIDDMLNPRLAGADKVATVDPMTQYVYSQKNTKKVGSALIKFSLVVGVIVVLVIFLAIMGIL